MPKSGQRQAANGSFWREQESVTPVELQPLPTYSKEGEQAVLASMLTQPETVVEQVMEVLMGSDFFIPANKVMFRALETLHDTREPIDITTVYQHLIDKKLMSEHEAKGALATLAGGHASSLNVMSYVKIVKEKSTLRGIDQVFRTALQDIYHCADAEKLIANTQARLDSIGMRNSRGPEPLQAPALVQEFRERIAEIAKGEKPVGVKTGFHVLDMWLMPLEKGSYSVITARTSVGKTALMLNLTRNWCIAGVSVLIFTLEMAAYRLMQRIFAFDADVVANNYSTPMGDDDARKFEQSADRVSRWKLAIHDAQDIGIKEIRKISRRHRRAMGPDEELVIVIDYLQLVEVDDEDERKLREQQLSNISRGAKAMAKELKASVVALAQLNRKSEEESEPQLRHIRECGSIEQDADNVLMLYKGDDRSDKRAMEVKVKIAKQRDGPVEVPISLYFDGPYQRFMCSKPYRSPTDLMDGKG